MLSQYQGVVRKGRKVDSEGKMPQALHGPATQCAQQGISRVSGAGRIVALCTSEHHPQSFLSSALC